MKRLFAVLVVGLLTAACSSNDIAAQGDRSRGGHQKQQGGSSHDRGSKGNGGSGGKGSQPTAAPGATVDPGHLSTPGNSQAPQGFGGGNAPHSGIDPSLARKSSSADDPTGDAKTKGLPPPYAEVIAASIEGLGKNVRLTFTMNGAVPESPGKNEYLVLAFGITGKDAESGYGIGVNGHDQTWTPYVGSKTRDSSQDYPGTFEVDGNHVIFVVPWSVVDGPRKFEWYGSAAWYSQIANQTQYSFDAIPDGHPGRFPG